MTPTRAKSLADALKKQFGGKVEYEAIARGKYRYAITSKKFDRMAHLKRQDRIWEVVDEVLPREATLDITTILAYSPADLARMA